MPMPNFSLFDRVRIVKKLAQGTQKSYFGLSLITLIAFLKRCTRVDLKVGRNFTKMLTCLYKMSERGYMKLRLW